MHRDVKPGNVLIDAAGRAVLADFGIARTQDSSTLTSSGVLVGSPSYIAPERARGERGGPESDRWSLGRHALRPRRGAASLRPRRAAAHADGGGQRGSGSAEPGRGAVAGDPGLLDHVPSRRLGPDEAERMLREVAGTGVGPARPHCQFTAQGSAAGSGRRPDPAGQQPRQCRAHPYARGPSGTRRAQPVRRRAWPPAAPDRSPSRRPRESRRIPAPARPRPGPPPREPEPQPFPTEPDPVPPALD